MTNIDIATQLNALVSYNEHANAVLLDAIDGLSDEQLDAKHGASWDSIRATMRHVLVAQNTWLGRWGRPVTASGADLRGAFAASHAALRDLMATSSGHDLARVVEYTDSRGAPFAVPLWQLLTHVCNHGTHHRAECGMLLGQLGRSPGDIDFLVHMLGRF